MSRSTFYVNAVSVSAIPVDVAVRFGFCTPGEEGWAEEICVHMSPVMAKLLAAALSGLVARYEADFGPLPEVAAEATVQRRLQ